MRRTAFVGGLVSSTLAIGAASAVGAPVDLTVDVTGGTVKAGSLAQSPSTGIGQLKGTIDSTTFAATFPATGNSLPSVTVPSATIGTYTGPITIDRKPGAFTGQGLASASGVSLNLSGTIAYTFTAGTNVCTGSSVVPGSAAMPTFTGGPIDLATGAFSASGSSPAPVLTPDLTKNPASGVFCLALAAQLALPNPVSSIASTITGKITIPGLIPLPTVTVIPPATTTPATTTPSPTTPAAPTPVAAPGRLALTITRPRTVRRGSSTVTKVVVRNTGAGTARSVTVRLAAVKGVTPRTTTKTYSAIGAGKTRTINVRLRTARSAARSSSLKVTATGASGLSASRSTTLRLR